jgi:DNA helicase MCM9
MFRNEVTRIDAIMAILCIESSMTTSAIVDSVGNSLHSNFTENPDEECILVSNLGMLNRTYKLAKTVIGWYLSQHLFVHAKYYY